jgi:hypothetical protein
MKNNNRLLYMPKLKKLVRHLGEKTQKAPLHKKLIRGVRKLVRPALNTLDKENYVIKKITIKRNKPTIEKPVMKTQSTQIGFGTDDDDVIIINDSNVNFQDAEEVYDADVPFVIKDGLKYTLDNNKVYNPKTNKWINNTKANRKRLNKLSE